MDAHRENGENAQKNAGIRIYYSFFPANKSSSTDLCDNGSCAVFLPGGGDNFPEHFRTCTCITQLTGGKKAEMTGISLNRRDPVKHCMAIKTGLSRFWIIPGKNEAEQVFVEAGVRR